jgi:hypothetical protein
VATYKKKGNPYTKVMVAREYNHSTIFFIVRKERKKILHMTNKRLVSAAYVRESTTLPDIYAWETY